MFSLRLNFRPFMIPKPPNNFFAKILQKTSVTSSSLYEVVSLYSTLLWHYTRSLTHSLTHPSTLIQTSKAQERITVRSAQLFTAGVTEKVFRADMSLTSSRIPGLNDALQIGECMSNEKKIR
jgi:hypothetical protein